MSCFPKVIQMLSAEVGSEFQQSYSSNRTVEAGDASLSPVWAWRGCPPRGTRVCQPLWLAWHSERLSGKSCLLWFLTKTTFGFGFPGDSHTGKEGHDLPT